MKKNIASSIKFPNLFATINFWIVMPLLVVVVIKSWPLYINKPVNEFLGIFTPTIGLTLALAALCGQIASVVNREDDTSWVFVYSAERFLHSSLLLIQTLAVAFAKESLLTMGWISKSDGFMLIIMQAMVDITGVCAYYCWFGGFYFLNHGLWSRWIRRVDRNIR